MQAHYTYDAFGNTVSQCGAMAAVFRFRFSSKYLDDETGLYYYGYRFYDPALGRWLSRDPIEELGALNLNSFCLNDSLCKFDYLGLENAEKEKCQMLKDYVLGSERHIYLMDLLSKNGCDIPDFICDCCGGDNNASYSVSGNIVTLCYNNLNDDPLSYRWSISHELYHAVQSCYKEKEDNRCKTSVCHEIEAYYNTRCSRIINPEARKDCVKSGVDASSDQFCKKWFGLGPTDQERIDKYFEELYDKCKERKR